MLTLNNSAHIYAPPASRERLIWCFTDVLGAEMVVSGDAPNLPTAVIAFRFPGGGALSVEFTDDALDEAQARRGAWLELVAGDAEATEALQRKIIAAGLTQIKHPGNDLFYFVAPGGQVLRIAARP